MLRTDSFEKTPMLTGRAPPRHAHGDLTSLAPHERLPEILVVSWAVRIADPWHKQMCAFPVYTAQVLGCFARNSLRQALGARGGFSPEARRGSQGASRATPGKSGLHGRGEGAGCLGGAGQRHPERQAGH